MLQFQKPSKTEDVILKLSIYETQPTEAKVRMTIKWLAPLNRGNSSLDHMVSLNPQAYG